MNPISHQPGFHCPVCGSEGYVHVSVRRADDSWRTTPLYQCCGCTAVFMDPARFTARERMVLKRSGMSDVWALAPAPAVRPAADGAARSAPRTRGRQGAPEDPSV
jgi:predicted RNA-binding Zn-ribbon protein involved in translation (DUF1610 family)